jgi:hypothetical protein
MTKDYGERTMNYRASLQDTEFRGHRNSGNSGIPGTQYLNSGDTMNSGDTILNS